MIQIESSTLKNKLLFLLYQNLILENYSNFINFIFKQWCRSGVCVVKTTAFEKYTVVSKPITAETSEKTNLIDDRKYGNLLKSEHSSNRPTLVNYDDDEDVEEDDEEEENDIEVLDLILRSIYLTIAIFQNFFHLILTNIL